MKQKTILILKKVGGLINPKKNKETDQLKTFAPASHDSSLHLPTDGTTEGSVWLNRLEHSLYKSTVSSATTRNCVKHFARNENVLIF